ncbi:MAG: L-lactate dehydrogenase [Candidatus Magasanikbacteria bacterium]|nr:L-lactate dehydrogenase [Candidatus Magasanikbacteria bacterium]
MTIAIIGAGAVGAATAYALTIKNLAAEIILIDVNEEKERGEVMDIGDTLSLVETGRIRAGKFPDARRADIIVLTAGAAQKPGEARFDLVHKNVEITGSIFRNIGRLRPGAIVLAVANPVDIITAVAQKLSGLPASQVFGSGTTLDTARLKYAVGQHFGVSPQNVHGYVLGEHGDSEFVGWSTVAIGGTPIKKQAGMSPQIARDIEARVKREAYEIIARKGATYFGIALVVTNIIEAVVYDQHLILPVSSRLNDWNGVADVCLGAPAIVGRRGVEGLWPVSLTAAERTKLKKSAQILRGYLDAIE